MPRMRSIRSAAAAMPAEASSSLTSQQAELVTPNSSCSASVRAKRGRNSVPPWNCLPRRVQQGHGIGGDDVADQHMGVIGEIAPDQIVPVAEAMGLDPAIGEQQPRVLHGAAGEHEGLRGHACFLALERLHHHAPNVARLVVGLDLDRDWRAARSVQRSAASRSVAVDLAEAGRRRALIDVVLTSFGRDRIPAARCRIPPRTGCPPAYTPSSTIACAGS